MKLIRIFLVACIAAFSFSVNAQQRTAAVKLAKPIGVKPPKLIASIGSFKDTMDISVKDAAKIIGMPLKITDAKGVSYELSSYQFLYRQIVTSEDEQTGKPYSTYSVKSSLFKTSPLPPIWINVVSENLRAGEEFIFFDVIAKDAKGFAYYAPVIKLTLK